MILFQPDMFSKTQFHYIFDIFSEIYYFSTFCGEFRAAH